MFNRHHLAIQTLTACQMRMDRSRCESTANVWLSLTDSWCSAPSAHDLMTSSASPARVSVIVTISDVISISDFIFAGRPRSLLLLTTTMMLKCVYMGRAVESRPSIVRWRATNGLQKTPSFKFWTEPNWNVSLVALPSKPTGNLVHFSSLCLCRYVNAFSLNSDRWHSPRITGTIKFRLDAERIATDRVLSYWGTRRAAVRPITNYNCTALVLLLLLLLLCCVSRQNGIWARTPSPDTAHQCTSSACPVADQSWHRRWRVVIDE